eukprot:gb/GEZN01002268.1/.p1 GENE.gb/GEZN01002268.1/~~gb/GEZN01002268.1/.p1  ORF type:complete len:599 (+),score=6.38 gb/GEZN01002268.1/:348-2144(+)
MSQALPGAAQERSERSVSYLWFSGRTDEYAVWAHGFGTCLRDENPKLLRYLNRKVDFVEDDEKSDADNEKERDSIDRLSARLSRNLTLSVGHLKEEGLLLMACNNDPRLAWDMIKARHLGEGELSHATRFIKWLESAPEIDNLPFWLTAWLQKYEYFVRLHTDDDDVEWFCIPEKLLALWVLRKSNKHPAMVQLMEVYHSTPDGQKPVGEPLYNIMRQKCQAFKATESDKLANDASAALLAASKTPAGTKQPWKRDENKQQGKGQRKPLTCYNCQRQGHKVADCRTMCTKAICKEKQVDAHVPSQCKERGRHVAHATLLSERVNDLSFQTWHSLLMMSNLGESEPECEDDLGIVGQMSQKEGRDDNHSSQPEVRSLSSPSQPFPKTPRRGYFPSSSGANQAGTSVPSPASVAQQPMPSRVPFTPAQATKRLMNDETFDYDYAHITSLLPKNARLREDQTFRQCTAMTKKGQRCLVRSHAEYFDTQTKLAQKWLDFNYVCGFHAYPRDAYCSPVQYMPALLPLSPIPSTFHSLPTVSDVSVQRTFTSAPSRKPSHHARSQNGTRISSFVTALCRLLDDPGNTITINGVIANSTFQQNRH